MSSHFTSQSRPCLMTHQLGWLIPVVLIWLWTRKYSAANKRRSRTPEMVRFWYSTAFGWFLSYLFESFMFNRIYMYSMAAVSSSDKRRWLPWVLLRSWVIGAMGILLERSEMDLYNNTNIYIGHIAPWKKNMKQTIQSTDHSHLP